MTDSRFFHLAYYGYEKTVIDSQVVTPALRLAQEGIDMNLVFLEDVSGWYTGAWNRHQESLAKQGLKSDFLPRVPRNFLGADTFLVEQFLKPHLKAGRVVVHARGIQGAHAMLPIRRRYPNLRLICDIRGMDSAEYVLDLVYKKGRQPNSVERYWANRLSAMEAEAVRGSDVVFCVSRSMIPRFQAKAASPVPFDYVPCAVDASTFSASRVQRDSVRNKLGIAGKLVIVYAGSLSAWQIPETMLRVVGRALKLFPDAVFLAVTPQPHRLRDASAKAGLPEDRVVAVRAHHREIASYLAAGDIGLLLREANEVNKYACPTKFAEYLACGLYVLATTAVDEVTSSLQRTGAGTLLASLESDSDVDAGLQAAAVASRAADRFARCEQAASEFDWTRHLPTLKKWYVTLASSTAS